MLCELKDFLVEQTKILDECGYEHGWADGGCQMLAEAIVKWSDGDFALGAVWELFGQREHITHVFAIMDGLMIDGDGVTFSPEEMLGRRPDAAKRGLRVGSFDQLVFDRDGSITAAPWVSDLLAKALADRFGSFTSSMINRLFPTP